MIGNFVENLVILCYNFIGYVFVAKGERREGMPVKNRLLRRCIQAVLALLISFFSLAAVTFAWYIYQTDARTSDIHMAVGTGSMLQISNQYDGEYSYSALLDSFQGRLNPVSTDRILGGFQKVKGFTNGSENQPRLLANLFGESESNDYYKTSLFLRLNAGKQEVYLYNIGYEDSDAKNPISTAIRIGFVIHEAGRDKPEVGEHIFAINQADNPQAEYNTATGMEGYVLDSSKTDGTTIPMEHLLTAENFCEYDKITGEITLKPDSKPLFLLEGGDGRNFGEPVQVDVYIWLEGCDKDCTNNLCGTMLKNISLSFAGLETK